MYNRQSHHNLRISFQLRYCSFCKLCPRGIVEHNLDVGKVGQARIGHLHVIFRKFTGCYFFRSGDIGEFGISLKHIVNCDVVEMHVHSSCSSAYKSYAHIFAAFERAEVNYVSTPAGRAVVAHPFRAVHGLPFASVGHHFHLDAFGRCHIAVVAVVHPETYGRMVERRNADFRRRERCVDAGLFSNAVECGQSLVAILVGGRRVCSAVLKSPALMHVGIRFRKPRVVSHVRSGETFGERRSIRIAEHAIGCHGIVAFSIAAIGCDDVVNKLLTFACWQFGIGKRC